MTAATDRMAPSVGSGAVAVTTVWSDEQVKKLLGPFFAQVLLLLIRMAGREFDSNKYLIVLRESFDCA